MEKKDIVRYLCKKFDITKNDMNQIFDAFIEIVREKICALEPVRIRELFSITFKACKPYHWTDFNTGEYVGGKPYYKAMISLASDLKEKIKETEVNDIDLKDLGIYEEKENKENK